MKLSVKWLAGLAVLALAVVAVVGSTSSTKAAEGKIFVANEWSKRTNESPAPTGYTSTGTVYSTYGTSTRLIQTDSDLVRVVVTDAGKDTLTPVTVAAANIDVDDDNDGHEPGGDDDNVLNITAGQQVVIFLNAQSGSPIAGADSTIDIQTGAGVSQIDNGVLQIVSRFNGGGGADPWIRVQRNSGAGALTLTAVTYQTSQQDTVTVKVKSDLEPNGVTVLAQETGLSTARFVGFVNLVQTTVTSTPSTVAGDQDAQVRTSVGPITLDYVDSDSVTRSTQVVVDTSAPTVSVTGPADGTATQNRRPTFSGAISETGSGLKIDQIAVIVDSSNDAANSNPAIVPTGGNGSGIVSLPISTSGAIDGDLSFSFSQAPTSDIPTFAGTPDHIVDWAVRSSDIAGNLGFSDADATDTTGAGNGNITGGYQLHTVKIDQQIPGFTTTAGNNKTGLAVDSAGTEVSSRRSIRVVFNDQVQNIQASDFVVTLDSGATAVPSGVTIRNNPGAFPNQGVVYLAFPFDLVSNETPVVAVQDTIQDLAGNSTATGSASVSDGIKPNLTVTLLSGSGTGSGSEGPAALTNNTIQVQVASDEALSNVPGVAVHVVGVGTAEASPAALSQGTNIWRATYTKPGAAATGDRAVVVTATDTAANSQTVGASGTKSFRLDIELPTPVVNVGGGSTTTSQLRPFVTIDFGAGSPAESATVTVAEVLLDGTDVTSSLVVSSNGTRFFIAPASDLSLGSHTVTIPVGEAEDAAGNSNTSAITLTFTVVERATFNIDVFAGWNALSFTSDPVDPDINAVFTNSGHDAVLGFDANVPGMWRIATRDAVSGDLTTTTENGLNSVRSTQAYWLHSNNFEPVEALLVGETLPGDGGAPSIPQIATNLGFNAVPIVDPTRKQTTGDAGGNLMRTPATGPQVAVTVDDYLGALDFGRVYRYSPETLTFVSLDGTTVVNTGEVLFVEVLTATPIFP